MHRLIELPKGKRVQDVLPQFAAVVSMANPFIVGEPCPICPGCSKPFTASRKPRQIIRLYSVSSLVPIVIQYRLCRSCWFQCRLGGSKRDGVLAAIENFMGGNDGN